MAQALLTSRGTHGKCQILTQLGRTWNGPSGIRRAIPSSAAFHPWPGSLSAMTPQRSMTRSRRAEPPEAGSAVTTRSPPRTLALSARLTTPWSGPIAPAAKGSISNAPRTAARASASPPRRRISRRFAAAPTASDPSRTESANEARAPRRRTTAPYTILYYYILTRGDRTTSKGHPFEDGLRS